MKSKLGILLATFALMLGLAGAASAQVVKHRTRNGRIVYETTTRRDNRRWNNRRYDNDRYDRYRRNNGRAYGRQTYGARTYRLPNGRLVTILPNGRRIYR
ncbi:MAG: hypothetical protein JOZ52_08025 [Acidobacteria bacterium]|nr:hypothetical protein [Acidobacteriota bacterium]